MKGAVVKVKDKDIRLQRALIKLRSQQSQGTIYHPESKIEIGNDFIDNFIRSEFLL